MTQFKSEEYPWPADVPLRMNKKEEMSPEELYAPVEHYKTEDPIVNTVMRRFKNRSDAGMKKYGVSMYDNKADIFAWITHAQEEAMDLILYLERFKQEIEGGC